MRNKSLLPLIISITLACGILLGYIITANSTQSLLGNINSKLKSRQPQSTKVGELVNILSSSYVDTIDIAQLEETLVRTALNQLDPHSSYIAAKDLEKANEQLDGSFSGIGVQFNIQQDTIYIVDVISKGPSERAGLLPGDRIIEVNDTTFVGKEVTNESVFNKLRGKKGSSIKLGIARRNTKETLHFNIVREDIPIHSIDVSYIVEPGVGLVSVNSFGANTYKEFLTHMAKLQNSGAKKVIVDLRGNAGGYLDAAANMINEFLKEDALIVYIEGVSYSRAESKASGTGSFQDMELVVLIDEFSGSASEIFAGAIQDNDRGAIIGRRSFGKGLVQQPFTFSDGSQARITVARYYTPSGRCIQKPYTRGKAEDYETDIWNRFMHGEFFSADSIKQNDSTEYKTVGGRIVYGGGGIMPDIFVPRDTIGVSKYFNALVNNNLLYKFALEYTDLNREQLKQYKTWQKLDEYLTKENLVSQLDKYTVKNGVKGNSKDKAISKGLIKRHIHSYIIRNILNDEGFYPYINSYDATVITAVKELKKQ